MHSVTPNTDADRQSVRATGYRPEIDGLRAIAVAMVVLFHAGLGFDGGYTGVDVFFVISGFLITRIITRDLDESRFSLGTFWQRRVRRLYPASCVMVIACAVAGWFLLPPSLYADLGNQILSVVSLSSNVFFWKTTDYWGFAADDKPLLHMWSLALEEQFYLVMPFCLAAIHRLGARWRFLALAAASLMSLTLCVLATPRYAAFSFYMLPTRAWELLAGALLASLPGDSRLRRLPTPLVVASGWLGVALILYAGWFFSKDLPFPGWRAIVPTSGAVLFLHSTDTTGGLLRGVFSLPPLRFLGLISYSLYLWHWPMLVLVRFVDPLRDDDLPTRFVAVILAVLVGWASWRYVETPFRKPATGDNEHARRSWNFRDRRAWLLASALGMTTMAITMVTLGGPSLASFGAHGERRGLPETRRLHERVDPDVPDGERRIGLTEGRVDVVIVGSSHGLMYLDSLDDCLRSIGVGGVSFARAAENPLTVRSRPWRGPLDTALAERDERIKAFLDEHRPRVVLCFHNWQTGIDEAVPYTTRKSIPLEKKGASLEEWVSGSASEWAACGATVIVVGPVPKSCGTKAFFEALVCRGLSFGREPIVSAKAREVAARHLERASGAGYRFIPVSSVLLASDRTVRIADPDTGVPYYEDDNHLTKEGGDLIVQQVLCDVIHDALEKAMPSADDGSPSR